MVAKNSAADRVARSLQDPLRVAVIGSGVSGLGSAWALSKYSAHDVTLYEANEYLGGHTHTVNAPSLKPGKTVAVDTGFIVFNGQNYPNLMELFRELNVAYEPSEMSFSVTKDQGDFEWAGSDNLRNVFAQSSNLWSPSFYRMIYDMIRFNIYAPSLLSLHEGHPERDMRLGQYLDLHNYSSSFRENYLLPMTAAIWSTPTDKCALDFPAFTLIRFMHNHSLLQVLFRPRWLTVTGGSQRYIDKIVPCLKDVRLNTPVRRVERNDNGTLSVVDSLGKGEVFDRVIMACHGDQAIRLLDQSATAEERNFLSNVTYSQNTAILHSDPALMPVRKRAWTSWNYLMTTDQNVTEDKVALTYWMNRLQNIDSSKHGYLFVTLNPNTLPKPSTVVGSWVYEHPIYTEKLIKAQADLERYHQRATQDSSHPAVSFAGAWTKYGFHEDGLTSGLRAACRLGAKLPWNLHDATHVGGTGGTVRENAERWLFYIFVDLWMQCAFSMWAILFGALINLVDLSGANKGRKLGKKCV